MVVFLKKHPKEFVIIILIAIIIIQRSCQPEHKPVNVTELSPSGIKIIREYTPVSLNYHFPDISKLVDTVIIHDTTKIIVIDTPAAIQDYIAKHAYIDTLYQGRQGYVAVIDTVQFNRILHRKKIVNLKPIYSYRPPNRKLYLGLGIDGGINQFGIAGKILYVDRKDHAYEYSYNPILKYHEIGILFKLRFRKREPP